jgi:hypothetical protein
MRGIRGCDQDRIDPRIRDQLARIVGDLSGSDLIGDLPRALDIGVVDSADRRPRNLRCHDAGVIGTHHAHPDDPEPDSHLPNLPMSPSTAPCCNIYCSALSHEMPIATRKSQNGTLSGSRLKKGLWVFARSFSAAALSDARAMAAIATSPVAVYG